MDAVRIYFCLDYMKKNTLVRSIVGLITVAAIFSFVYILNGAVGETVPLVDAGMYIPEATTTSISVPRGFATPSHLKIPSIAIDAKVQHVGLTANGAMGIPTNFTDVAWYKYGTIPGEVGSAVIDGHLDNGLGLSGVFKRLKELTPGDDVYVIDKNGTEIHFLVTDVKEYNYTEAPTEEIFNESEKSLLRLITCGGKWVKAAKTYETRVIVTAEYIP